MLAHDLRYTDDTDTIAVTVMDNIRVVTVHKDLNIVCWDVEQGLRIKSGLSCSLKGRIWITTVFSKQMRKVS